MSDFDYPAVPDSGDLQPYSPQTPLAPSAPGGFPDYYIQETDQPYPPDAPLPGQLFGVKVPGVTGQQIEAEILRPIVNDFLAEMQRLRIPAKYTTAAGNWLLTHAFTLPSWEAAAHHYSIAGIPISDDDMPYVVSFLNEMARVDADPPTVRIFLSYWWNRAPKVLENIARRNQQSAAPAGGASIDSLSDVELKAVLKAQPKFQQQTRDELRSKWGASFDHRMQVAANYFQTHLGEEERLFFESQVCKDGIILGDSAAAVEWMYQRAIESAKPNLQTNDLAGEIQAIEQLMRNDRARYNKDIALQERLRALYALRDGS